MTESKINMQTTYKKDTAVICSEFAVVLYFWIYQIIQPLIWISPSNSKLFVLLALFVGCLLLIALYREKYSAAHIAVLCFFSFFILFDVCFRHNSMTITYVEYFIMYAVLPFLFVAGVRDFEKLLTYFGKSCIIALVYTFCLLLLKLDSFYGGYMDIGFGLLLPSYFGIAAYRLRYKKKYCALFEIACLLTIIIVANRSCLLSILVFWIFYWLVFAKNRKRMRWIFFAIFVAILLIVLNLKSIVRYIDVNFIEAYAIAWRPWYYVKQLVLVGDLDRFTSGRVSIWIEACQYIARNPILGYGTGYFDTVSAIQNYPHNIILELVLQWGIMFAVLFVGLLLYSGTITFRALCRYQNKTALILFIMLFSLWFPKLLLSNTYMKDVGFWLFLSFILIKTKRFAGRSTR